MSNALLQSRTRDLFLNTAARSSAERAVTLAALPAGARPRRFSEFRPDHEDRALELADQLMLITDRLRGDAGISAVLDEVSNSLSVDDPDLVMHALKIFITHHPEGRMLTSSVPRLIDRQLAERGAAAVSYHGAADPPDGLEWYREDPFANEHHEHWHVVYPTRGLLDRRDNRRRTKDRQGELFFYMHRQMLARYDAERAAVSLPRVQPFDDYRQPIDQGYNPGPAFEFTYSTRAKNVVLPGIAEPDLRYTVSDHEVRRERFQRIVETGEFESVVGIPVTVDRLGATAEPTINSVSDRTSTSYYGNWHGLGHGLIAAANGAADALGGVMQNTATAIRDPVFYRWHKHIDDVYRAWQDRDPFQDLAADPPYVRIRKSLAGGVASSPDIRFCFVSALGGEDPQQLGTRLLGGSNWKAAAEAPPFTSVLETRMKSLELELRGGGKAGMQHLVHEEFVYFLRVQNQLPRHYTVTARVFLAPLTTVADTDRTVWIEMDKFLVELVPREQKVIARLGSESSVVRKPAEMHPTPLRQPGFVVTDDVLHVLTAQAVPGDVLAKLAVIKDQPFPTATVFLERLITEGVPATWHDLIAEEAFQGSKPVLDDAAQDRFNYCTCGWPYNLLLPRGTASGMAFRVFVIFTDWDVDRLGPDSCCGSVSFCGARDFYPDKRPMGYPFDRRFQFSIPDTAMAYDHIAMRHIIIRCTNI